MEKPRATRPSPRERQPGPHRAAHAPGQIPQDIADPSSGPSRDPGLTPPFQGPGFQSPTDPEAEARGEPPPPHRPAALRAAPYWALSALLHLILFLLLLQTALGPTRPRQEEVTVPIRDRPLPGRPPPAPRRDLVRLPDLRGRELVRDPSIERQLDVVTPEIPRGSELGTTGVEVTGPSVFDALGLGAGSAGPLGDRRGRGLRRGAGPSAPSESAIDAALEWLRRHQDPDGSWKAREFTARCRSRCQNLDPARPGEGRGLDAHDVGVTALAVLAFAGHGQTHRDGDRPEQVACVKRALSYLKRSQLHSTDPALDGRFGQPLTQNEQWVYGHAVATLAVCELLAMTGDAIGLKRCARDAVKLCLRAQNPGFGWRYGVRPGDNDTSVTGWMVLALKMAKSLQLDIPAEEYAGAFQGALTWIHRATSAAGRTGYQAPGDDGSRLATDQPTPYPHSKELSCMTAVAVLCRLFAGESRNSGAVRDGVKLLAEHPPRWQEQKGRSLATINLYYWYYGSYALFQLGGPDWKAWSAAMERALVDHQRQGNADEDGSWDPLDEWGPAGGRVYSTALGALTLEVHYRFRRLEESRAP